MSGSAQYLNTPDMLIGISCSRISRAQEHSPSRYERRPVGRRLQFAKRQLSASSGQAHRTSIPRVRACSTPICGFSPPACQSALKALRASAGTPRG